MAMGHEHAGDQRCIKRFGGEHSSSSPTQEPIASSLPGSRLVRSTHHELEPLPLVEAGARAVTVLSVHTVPFPLYRHLVLRPTNNRRLGAYRATSRCSNLVTGTNHRTCQQAGRAGAV
eukprot:7440397-Pyramimonas_sp.AAC.1